MPTKTWKHQTKSVNYCVFRLALGIHQSRHVSSSAQDLDLPCKIRYYGFINALSSDFNLLFVVTVRRRVTLILLFPIIAILFALGWVLSVVGEKQKNGNATPTRKTRHDIEEESPTNVSEVEMGLIEEIVEESPVD